MRKRSTFTVVLAICTISLAAEGAAQTADCSPFEVFLGTWQLEVIDLGAAGLSIGDRRVGSLDLLNADGAVIGQSLFESTVAGSHDGRYRLIGNAHHIYDNGTLHYKVVYELPDPTDPRPQVDLPRFEYHVTGGTKAFAGAQGTVRTALGDDGRRIIALDIECDR